LREGRRKRGRPVSFRQSIYSRITELRLLLFGTNIPIALNAGFCSGSAFAAAGTFAATFSVTAVAAGSAGGRTVLSDMMCCGWWPFYNASPKSSLALDSGTGRTKSRLRGMAFRCPRSRPSKRTTPDTTDCFHQRHILLLTPPCVYRCGFRPSYKKRSSILVNKSLYRHDSAIRWDTARACHRDALGWVHFQSNRHSKLCSLSCNSTFLHDVTKDSYKAATLANSAWYSALKYANRGKGRGDKRATLSPELEELVNLLAQRHVSKHYHPWWLIVLTTLNRMNGARLRCLMLPAMASDHSVRLFLYGLAVIQPVEMESPSFGMPMPMSSLESQSTM
jgi:hypothetical protein